MPVTETTILVEFAVEKETPGTFRYTEVTEEEKGVIGTLYLRKDVAESLGKPERLLVKLEVA
jgi:hypothetical protein